jgi:hypothetical protein
LFLPSARLRAQTGQPLQLDCTLPFEAISEDRGIDDECGIEGETAIQKLKLQNRAKNNFCATGRPEYVTFYSFRKPQEAAEALDLDVRTSRDQLRDLHTTHLGGSIGEGTHVQLAGYGFGSVCV